MTRNGRQWPGPSLRVSTARWQRGAPPHSGRGGKQERLLDSRQHETARRVDKSVSDIRGLCHASILHAIFIFSLSLSCMLSYCEILMCLPGTSKEESGFVLLSVLRPVMESYTSSSSSTCQVTLALALSVLYCTPTTSEDAASDSLRPDLRSRTSYAGRQEFHCSCKVQRQFW